MKNNILSYLFLIAAALGIAAPLSAQSSVFKVDCPGMSPREINMLGEINSVRSNPKAYAEYIKAYLAEEEADFKKGNLDRSEFKETERAAKELLKELGSMKALPVLDASGCVFKAARLHGEEEIERKSTDHVGLDGSYPWDRIQRTCGGQNEGGECLVGGPDDTRRALILLLVDAGIDDRGHRKTLLDPGWKTAGCYYAGMVGTMPNCWVLNFGLL